MRNFAAENEEKFTKTFPVSIQQRCTEKERKGMEILKLCWDEGEDSRMFGVVLRAEPGLDTGCGLGMSAGYSCSTSWRKSVACTDLLVNVSSNWS